MLGLSFVETLFILLIAFLVIGPKQFPAVAKNFIKLLNELRSGFSDIKSEWDHIENKTNKLEKDLKENLSLKPAPVKKPSSSNKQTENKSSKL